MEALTNGKLQAALAKYAVLQDFFRKQGSAAVAFSGGVDSSLLLYAAHDALGEKAVAFTVDCCSVPRRELAEAAEFCSAHGIRQKVCAVDQLQIPGFANNPPERCYICKKALFAVLLQAAAAEGAVCLAEGSNTDDMLDYRPGMKAVAELKVPSPLRDAGLSKAEIRLLARHFGLRVWDKPSFACLASRFAYGEKITKRKLAMAEQGEQLLLDLGFRQFRVRLHGEDTARIEVLPEQFGLMMRQREKIARCFKEYGFTYVALDLEGYRSGSMNENMK